MFLTYFINGNQNVGTQAGAPTALRMCNPLNTESLLGLIGELLQFPRPIILIPLSGSDRTLTGVGDDDVSGYGTAADGTIGRLQSLFSPIQVAGKQLWVHLMHDGGAFLACRIPPHWLRDEHGHPLTVLHPDWVMMLDRVRGMVTLAIAAQRGQARPVTCVCPEGNRINTDELVLMWHTHTTQPGVQAGEWISSYDVVALSHAASQLGYTLEQKAELPIITRVNGDTWKAAHAGLKYFAVGSGVPCTAAIVDTTDGMLAHPLCRGILAVMTLCMQGHEWSTEKLLRCAVTRPFIDPTLVPDEDLHLIGIEAETED